MKDIRLTALTNSLASGNINDKGIMTSKYIQLSKEDTLLRVLEWIQNEYELNETQTFTGKEDVILLGRISKDKFTKGIEFKE